MTKGLFDLSGKVAIVTGAGRGLGKNIAVGLAQHGADVVVVSRILADIHGNTMALDNVLKDAEALGVGEYWFLGDYAAIGYDPVGALERIANLPNARFLRGNTDRSW